MLKVFANEIYWETNSAFMFRFIDVRDTKCVLTLLVLCVLILTGCQKEDPVLNLASVGTANISTLGSTFAVVSGEVLNDGGTTVTDAGIVWSTEPNPTVELPTKIKSNTLNGNFSLNIFPLSILTKYYVRVYATNSVGTTYGTEVSFTTTDKGPCLVSQFAFKSYSTIDTYQLTYGTNNKIDLSAPAPQSKYIYSGDSTYVYGYSSGQLKGLLMTSASTNGKVRSIKKYFASTGGIYWYSFDYSVTNQVAITLSYLNTTYPPNTPPQKVAKGEYQTDNKGNVIQLLTYLPDSNGNWVLNKTSTYTYDQSENPVRGQLYPFFDYQALPKVQYLSSSNVLSETVGATTTRYVYTYAANGLPNSAINSTSSLQEIQFNYINCPF